MLARQRCHRTQYDPLPWQQEDFPPGGEQRGRARDLRKKDKCLPATARPDQRVLEVFKCNWTAGPRYHVGERSSLCNLGNGSQLDNVFTISIKTKSSTNQLDNKDTGPILKKL